MRLIAALCLALGLGATPALAGPADNSLNFPSLRQIDTLDEYYNAQAEITVLTDTIYDRLLYRDPFSLELRPALATAWRMVDDRTIEFTLRQGVRFHNGDAFTADDVVYTVAFAKNPENRVQLAASRFGYLDRAEAVDAHTVRIHLTAPNPSALERLSQTLPILPAGYHARVGRDAFGQRPVGTGPYRVAQFTPGGQVVLERNADYFEAAWGRPRLARINVLPIYEIQTQVAEMMAGRVDLMWRVPPDIAERMGRVPQLHAVSGRSLRTFFFSMDAMGRAGPSPLQDIRVRRAVSHAINREAIARNLVRGAAEVIHAICHPRQFGCSQDVARYAYDPARARALLAEAGLAGAVRFQLHAFGPENRPIIEAVIGDLRQVGIQVDLQFAELGAWIQRFQGGRANSAIVAWASGNIFDTGAFVTNFFTETPGDYARNPAVVAAFRAADQTADPDARRALFREGLHRIADQAYVLPMFIFSTFYVHRDRLDFVPPEDGAVHLYRLGWR
jgi:peptide/nickel transport system substrate-binding protein